jgi:hypothetical protein
MLIFFELCAELIGSDRWNEAIGSDAHVFVSVTEGSGSAGSGVRYLIVAIASI